MNHIYWFQRFIFSLIYFSRVQRSRGVKRCSQSLLRLLKKFYGDPSLCTDKEGFFEMLKLRGLSLNYEDIMRDYEDKGNRKRVKSRMRPEA
jgi:hypothetical protein